MHVDIRGMDARMDDILEFALRRTVNKRPGLVFSNREVRMSTTAIVLEPSGATLDQQFESIFHLWPDSSGTSRRISIGPRSIRR